MIELGHHDGSWQRLQDDWAKQCGDFGEEFSRYMPATLPLLADQIEICSGEKWNGVYGIQGTDGTLDAVAFVNCSFIPGFKERVMRVRNLILAPRYDFGDYSEDEYALLLTEVFESVLELSEGPLPCPHVKVHFRSPADVALFREFSEELAHYEHFSDIKMVGSWLFISKVLN